MSGWARPDRSELLAIFLGGCAGALARTGLAKAFPVGDGWPWATFAVNVAGAFVLAYVVTRLQERLPPTRYWRPLLGTGLCGALTTFSTVQVELFDLLDAGRTATATGYVAATLAAGLAAVVLASALARRTRLLT